MGTFFTEVQLAAPLRPDRRATAQLLVDSGSVYTWVSSATLRDLGVEATEHRRLLTIEGRTIDRGMAEVLITLEGRTLHTLCVFGEPGDLDVLGAYTLEGFGLAVDPVQRRLIPAIRYGAEARGRRVIEDDAREGSGSVIERCATATAST
jgi:predicted aspartyl protease